MMGLRFAEKAEGDDGPRRAGETDQRTDPGLKSAYWQISSCGREADVSHK
jgi:hypothetical protein